MCEWIEADSKKPDVGIPVIVQFCDGEVYTQCMMLFSDSCGYYWKECFGTVAYDFDNVSYWMHLPMAKKNG